MGLSLPRMNAIAMLSADHESCPRRIHEAGLDSDIVARSNSLKIRRRVVQ